ncbi:MAG: serine hydrolase, partial [candidate division KSB1 bacterium]|nr:serine hydrolase [candidate division KSB1 bacterium]
FIMFQFREDHGDAAPILKRSTVLEMQRVHWLQPNWQSGWGLGFSISHRGDKTFIGHGGWVAGYRTQILLCPADKIGIIVMCNAEDASPAFFANRIFDVIAPAIADATEKPKPAAEIQPGWEKYLGRYTDPTDWQYEVMIVNQQLVLYGYDYPPEENPTENVIELTPVGEHTFRLTGDNGDGELLIFELAADGSVARIKKGENYLYPVK